MAAVIGVSDRLVWDGNDGRLYCHIHQVWTGNAWEYSGKEGVEEERKHRSWMTGVRRCVVFFCSRRRTGRAFAGSSVVLVFVQPAKSHGT